MTRKDGVWYIGWKNKEYQSLEGPFKQAQSAKWAFAKELENRTNHEYRKRILFGWGVVFPDIIFNEEDPEWDLSVVFDESSKDGGFGNYIERLEKYTREREKKSGRHYSEKLDSREIKTIVNCFRHDFDVEIGRAHV